MRAFIVMLLALVQVFLIGFVYPFLMSASNYRFPILGVGLMFLNVFAYVIAFDSIKKVFKF